MGIKLDFTDADTKSGFEPLEPALYRAHVSKVEPRKGKTSGKPYLSVEFELPDEDNRKLWQNFSLQPQSLWALKAFMVTLGFDPDDMGGEFELEEEEIVGNECCLNVGPPEEGRKNNVIESIVSIDDWNE